MTVLYDRQAFCSRVIALMAAFLLFAATGCQSISDRVPSSYPTPQPPPMPTPVAPLALKRDDDLEKQFAKIAEAAKGKVGVAAAILETGDSASLNALDNFPMQSVYKMPISMAVLDEIRRGERDLDEHIMLDRSELANNDLHSPLRDENPNGGEFTIRQLIKYAIENSDGTASDALMKIAGGPEEVESYLMLIGISDIKIVNTENEMAADQTAQYRNYARPLAALQMLAWFRSSLTDNNVDPEGIDLLNRYMIESVPGAERLKGLLPKGTEVAHKTGTSGTLKQVTSFTNETGTVTLPAPADITPATNDIGIIRLPNGKHLAIAVFIRDSAADQKTRESVIAKMAKAAWDKWGN